MHPITGPEKLVASLCEEDFPLLLTKIINVETDIIVDRTNALFTISEPISLLLKTAPKSIPMQKRSSNTTSPILLKRIFLILT
ncbi:hypothetical protein EAM01S_03_00600 [Erwinia amylovora NBRC 12687 = CFBP 1232]|nr:hypothetical protein EAM01S_03_00600 [Erwinia amylovora NBRC 12687 = CFBP 1232]